MSEKGRERRSKSDLVFDVDSNQQESIRDDSLHRDTTSQVLTRRYKNLNDWTAVHESAKLDDGDIRELHLPFPSTPNLKAEEDEVSIPDGADQAEIQRADELSAELMTMLIKRHRQAANEANHVQESIIEAEESKSRSSQRAPAAASKVALTRSDQSDRKIASRRRPSLQDTPRVESSHDKDGRQETVQSNAPSLTHIGPSGGASMVDVGAKQSTRRVAIARCDIAFSNSNSHRLLVGNDNPKGDVFGAARIAGIMAAKRTSDLIPLCHPIAITKADVDLELVPPWTRDPSYRRNANPHGTVQVLAKVETVGPTGVEMEALTAASTAALTIYDMCKAVDKQMLISGLRVVYKSGGRSGLHYDEEWVGSKVEEYFVDRQLEVPTSFRERAKLALNETRRPGLSQEKGKAQITLRFT